MTRGGTLPFGVLMAAVAVGLVAGFGGGAGGSFFAGVLGVVVPQLVVVFWLYWGFPPPTPPIGDGGGVKGVFRAWGVKFSLTVLFLALLARGLGEAGLLVGPAFVGGVVVGVGFNVWSFARGLSVVDSSFRWNDGGGGR